MSETTVAHWDDRLPGYVYVGRKGEGYFGNPYWDGPRLVNIARFALYFRVRLKHDPEFRSRVHALRGKQLVCHCSPLPCHGDVIAEYLNRGDLLPNEP